MAVAITVAVVALAGSPIPFLPEAHAARVKSSQWSVLQALKSEWGGFSGSETWSSGSDCGSMAGVTCTSQGDIISMDLSNAGLKGSILTSIGTLSELSFLNLGDNQLSGSIPANLDSLWNLIRLRLNNNQLTGSIPDGMMTLMINLQVLNLGKNKLTGPLPVFFANPGVLNEMNIGDNQLSGSIPANYNILTGLTRLRRERTNIYPRYRQCARRLENLIFWITSNKNKGPHQIASAS
ncbi:unnamed protein product [Closterium sp. Yama58-4]|nr:unnamed protein product [Closterium sp. Yama58-4]